MKRTTTRKRVLKGHTDSNSSMIIQTCLEEHRALRSEIEQHLTSMRYLIIFNMTASGTLLSFFASNVDVFKPLPVLIPYLSSLLGYIAFFHCVKISRLGHYISHTLTPKIRLLTNDDSILNWENYSRQQWQRKHGWLALFSLHGIILFIHMLVSFFGIGVALGVGEISGALIIGILLTTVLAVLYFYAMKEEISG